MNTKIKDTQNTLIASLIAFPFVLAISLFRPTVIYVIWNWVSPMYDITSITFLQSIILVFIFDLISKTVTISFNSK